MESEPALMPLLHRLFEDAVRGFEEEAAVVFKDRQMTYLELDRQASALSCAILHNAGEEEIIGIDSTRSLDMVISLLAILKSGKAYLPLDPTFPAHRLGQVISGSGVRFCVSSPSGQEVFKQLGLSIIPPNVSHSLPVRSVVHQNPNACVLYTSGSTGKPKGVCVPHQGLVDFLRWQKANSKAGPYVKTLQFCHLGFDVSIEEIFVPLITGGTLYLIDDNYRLDSGNLLSFVDRNSINRMYLPYVELQYFTEEAVRENFFPQSLTEVLTGGELLKITPEIAAFFQALPHCPLMNKYGPTEACVWVTELKLSGEALKWPEIPTIGKPIAGAQIFLLNESLEQVPEGETGEICIHGSCTANGYLNEPELTAGSFIDWSVDGHTRRIYRTGDLGRQLPDGNIEFHGRRDGQVKIRGNRIELADIEVALARQEGVRQAVVIAREDVPGKKYLAAYLVRGDGPLNIRLLREKLAGLLPDFMVPSFFIQLDRLPRTSSGKVDRKMLPRPESIRPDIGVLYKKPATGAEMDIAEVLANILGYDKIGADDNFFEFGGNSLLAQKAISELRHRFGYSLPITKLYRSPTVSGMAAHIGAERPQVSRSIETLKKPMDRDNDIAIIAMSGRFPGANTIEEFWEVLKSGKETLSFFREEELDPAVPSSLREDPLYVKARGVVENVDQFDPEFFGINPKLAELMDPQHRLFMEISWEALENAGYFPGNGHSDIGVFAGSYNNTYYLNNVQHNKRLVGQVGEFQVMSANEKDFIASRTAYHLNLKGPAVSVYSACSTSLLAIAQAVESLRKGQCTMALAGGASVHSPVKSGHLYQEGAMLSSDGHCRPFAAGSTGTLFCDGAGVVLLKSLKKAEEDGDTVYAVIKGVGVNNDGGGKGSFTAPSAEGQAGAISMALNDAGVDPASIRYIEAHGTGTPLGDPIEMEGLGLAFGPQPNRQYCAIGSVKSNMGHLTAAAGVAGLIKTVLALHYSQIPPSLGFEKPNPEINFADSPFYVSTSLTDWEQKGPRRAGVSSFGIGGTNVHVVLESAAESAPESPIQRAERIPQLVTWSAGSIQSLDGFGSKLLDFSRDRPDVGLADLAFTLQKKRTTFNHRRFVVASSMDEFRQKLSAPTQGYETASLKVKPGEIVFSFPGQGAQYLNMGRGLYDGEPAYRNAVDSCAEILKQYTGSDIRKIIFPDLPDGGTEDMLKDTRNTQPALFVTGYALARLWMSWGIEPSVLCGHSIGEFVAAHLAGVFSLEDALKLIASRGSLIGSLPGGRMLSVRAGADEIEGFLPDELSVAAINTNRLCVLSGAEDVVAGFARELDKRAIPNRLLLTSHAFHSSLMDPAVEEFKKVIHTITLKSPRKPIISTVTGTWLKDGEATDPGYWAEHIRKTVNFAGALNTVAGLDSPLFIEVGPGNVTSVLAKQQMTGRNIPIITSLERTADQAEHKGFLKALGQAWLQGAEPNWDAFYDGQNRKKLVLPNYAFNRRRCWVDPPYATAPVWKAERPAPENTATIPVSPVKIKESRPEKIENRIRELLEASGIEMADTSTGFLEMGLDSLLLTQISLTLKKEFNLPITFRQLNEEYSTPALLIEYLDQQLSAGFYKEQEISLGTEAVQDCLPENRMPNDSAGLRESLEMMGRQLQQLSEQMARIQDQLLKGQLPPAETGHKGSIARANLPSNGGSRDDLTPTDSLADFTERKVTGEPVPGTTENVNGHFMAPPVPGARLGKDRDGNPAWFLADPNQPGRYFQIIE